MPKTNTRIALAVLSIVAVTLLALASVRAARAISEWSIDGPLGLANGVVFGEDTVFSAGYSAAAFERVAPGMTRAEVHALLGEPLGNWTASREDSWDLAERFSVSPADTNYRMRFVFYAGDVVVETRGEYYID